MEGNPYDSPESRTYTSSEVPQRDRDMRTWAMFLHLSALLGVTAMPILGFVVPIVIWQVKKDEFPELDVHGRVVANWLISSLIYFAICFALIFVVVGIPLFIIYWVIVIVFPLIGGLKANNGEVWEYPGTFRFL